MASELIERLAIDANTKIGLGSTRYADRDDLNAVIDQHQQMLDALKEAEAFAEKMLSGVRFSDRAAAADAVLDKIRAAIATATE